MKHIDLCRVFVCQLWSPSRPKSDNIVLNHRYVSAHFDDCRTILPIRLLLPPSTSPPPPPKNGTATIVNVYVIIASFQVDS
ncbi:hypothetical protein RDWZM_009791, partial [Blomia tropicalis]